MNKKEKKYILNGLTNEIKSKIKKSTGNIWSAYLVTLWLFISASSILLTNFDSYRKLVFSINSLLEGVFLNIFSFTLNAWKSIIQMTTYLGPIPILRITTALFILWIICIIIINIIYGRMYWAHLGIMNTLYKIINSIMVIIFGVMLFIISSIPVTLLFEYSQLNTTQQVIISFVIIAWFYICLALFIALLLNIVYYLMGINQNKHTYNSGILSILMSSPINFRYKKRFYFSVILLGLIWVPCYKFLSSNNAVYFDQLSILMFISYCIVIYLIKNLITLRLNDYKVFGERVLERVTITSIFLDYDDAFLEYPILFTTNNKKMHDKNASREYFSKARIFKVDLSSFLLDKNSKILPLCSHYQLQEPSRNGKSALLAIPNRARMNKRRFNYRLVQHTNEDKYIIHFSVRFKRVDNEMIPYDERITVVGKISRISCILAHHRLRKLCKFLGLGYLRGDSSDYSEDVNPEIVKIIPLLLRVSDGSKTKNLIEDQRSQKIYTGLNQGEYIKKLFDDIENLNTDKKEHKYGTDQYNRIDNEIRENELVIDSYIAQSSTSISLKKDSSDDQRFSVLINQKYGTGKTTSTFLSLNELRKNVTRISPFESSVTDDYLFQIYRSVRKTHENSNFKKILSTISNWFSTISTLIEHKSLLVYYFISAFSLSFGIYKIKDYLTSGFSPESKSNTSFLFNFLSSIYKNESVINSLIILGSLIITVFAFPYFMKLMKQEASIYSDYFSSVCAKYIKRKKIVILLEDIDRESDTDKNKNLFSAIAGINASLQEIEMTSCCIVITADESTLNQIDEWNDLKSKLIYNTYDFNPNIVSQYTHLLKYYIATLKSIDDANAFEQSVLDLKSPNEDTKSAKEINLRDISQQYLRFWNEL